MVIRSDLSEAEEIADNIITLIESISLSDNIDMASDTDVPIEMERVQMYNDMMSNVNIFTDKATEDANKIKEFGSVFSEIDETIGKEYT